METNSQKQQDDKTKESRNELVFSYLTLRNLIGFGGMLLPLILAFVPTKMDCLLLKSECTNCILSVHTNNGGVFKTLAGTGWHFAFAATFLFSLAIMSIFFFTKSDEDKNHKKPDGKTTQKGKRNRVFVICGIIIIASLVVLGVYFISGIDLKPFPTVYAFETVAVEAFGFSWLVKGQTLWPDGEHYMATGLRMVKESLNKKSQ